jgi:hypothetical protein
MEATCSSTISVDLEWTTQHCIPEDRLLSTPNLLKIVFICPLYHFYPPPPPNRCRALIPAVFHGIVGLSGVHFSSCKLMNFNVNIKIK